MAKLVSSVPYLPSEIRAAFWPRTQEVKVMADALTIDELTVGTLVTVKTRLNTDDLSGIGKPMLIMRKALPFIVVARLDMTFYGEDIWEVRQDTRKCTFELFPVAVCIDRERERLENVLDREGYSPIETVM